MAKNRNYDRNPSRGCNYGLEGGAFLILGGCNHGFRGVQYILVLPFNYRAGAGECYFSWELS